MANKRKYTLSVAGEDDPIYKNGFNLHPISPTDRYIYSREKNENVKNDFLVKINTKKDRKSRLQHLIKTLIKNGWSFNG